MELQSKYKKVTFKIDDFQNFKQISLHDILHEFKMLRKTAKPDHNIKHEFGQGSMTEPTQSLYAGTEIFIVEMIILNIRMLLEEIHKYI